MPKVFPGGWRELAATGTAQRELQTLAELAEGLDDEFEAANRRASKRIKKTGCATSAHYERKTDRLVIALSTGIEVAFRPRDAQGLERALPHQLDTIEISPSGLGIHFPKLDADIYLPGLPESFFGSKQWIVGHLGKMG